VRYVAISANRSLFAARPEHGIEVCLVDLGGERAQGTCDRRVRELAVTDIDAAAEQHQRPVAPRGSHQLLDQPALPTPASPDTITVAASPDEARSTAACSAANSAARATSVGVAARSNMCR
jgi:hypothetical protein